jgi:glycosyltransferase involved in cell wall biosynthesis
MKISFILPGRGRSGGTRVTVVAANKLIERGHKVRILYKSEPFTIRGLYRSFRGSLIFSSVSDWLQEFQGKVDTFDDITKMSFENKEIIIGVGMWASNQIGRLDSLANPKVQYIHGATPWAPELMRRTLSLSIPKIVVASYLKPLAESFGGGEVLEIIPNGIDREEYFPSLNESQRDGIGTIYSSQPAKDPKTLLAVIDRISKVKPNIPIRMFGIDRRPKELEHIYYWRLPTVEKAREIYSRSLVWVLASMSEGFPAPVLEAMACGCVVVATNCGGTRDMIRDGENGFLVSVGNVNEILDRVSILLNDRLVREKMRRMGDETAKKFSWETTINALENVLNKVS